MDEQNRIRYCSCPQAGEAALRECEGRWEPVNTERQAHLPCAEEAWKPAHWTAGVYCADHTVGHRMRNDA